MVKNSHFETLYKIQSDNFCLEAKNILEKLSIENCPVGMGGCKSQDIAMIVVNMILQYLTAKNKRNLFLNPTKRFIVFIMEHYRKPHLAFYCNIMV